MNTFLHDLKYELLSIIRTKELIIWVMLFPIALGLFFNAAFSGIYEKTTKFSAVPVAVVNVQEDTMFSQVIDSVGSGDDRLLDVTESASIEEAEKLLRDGDVDGILIKDGGLSLTVAEKGINQTILKSFADSYNLQETIITDAIKSGDFMKIEEITSALSEEARSVSDVKLTSGSTDNLSQYYYNLIAMVALYGEMLGLNITIRNQANLSDLGMRRQCSPRKKSFALFVSLCAAFIVQTLCMLISVTFVRFVLGVDLGSRLGLVYLSGILGGIMGVCLGFAVGSIGKGSYDKKSGVTIAVVMFLCFLSGLMVANMKPLLEEKAPWVNKINPAAVVSDSFYCLVLYDDLDRYYTKLITMVVLSVVFAAAGFAMTRRRKYESL